MWSVREELMEPALVSKEMRALAVGVGVVGLDQVTKLWARGLGRATLNRGGVLGVLPGTWWVVLMVGVLCGVVWMWRKSLYEVEQVGLMIVFWAGLSNLVDRLVWTGVWDFIDYRMLRVSGNVADILLGVGVGVLVLWPREGSWWQKQKTK